MEFYRTIEKLEWENMIWNNLFDLVQSFKERYNLTIESFGNTTESYDKYYFTLGKYQFWAEHRYGKLSLLFEADTTREDFDKKFKFINDKIEQFRMLQGSTKK